MRDYIVTDRDGHCGDLRTVYSTHATERAALKACDHRTAVALRPGSRKGERIPRAVPLNWLRAE